MKSSDTTSPDESNNETSNPQEPNAQSERFDMSVITDMPKWQRVLKAMDCLLYTSPSPRDRG